MKEDKNISKTVNKILEMDNTFTSFLTLKRYLTESFKIISITESVIIAQAVEIDRANASVRFKIFPLVAKDIMKKEYLSLLKSLPITLPHIKKKI